MTVPAEYEDILDEVKGRDFLEKYSLLVSAGEPSTLASLATCLSQVTLLPGVGRTAAAAVTSVALLVEELEEIVINECVKSAATTELNELAKDIRELITDMKDQITSHVKQFTSTETQCQHVHTPSGSPTYTEALVAPPPHADPRLAAREVRQFMLEGLDTTKRVSQLSDQQIP